MVEIESYFFQLSISAIKSNCIKCNNTLGIALDLNPFANDEHSEIFGFFKKLFNTKNHSVNYLRERERERDPESWGYKIQIQVVWFFMYDTLSFFANLLMNPGWIESPNHTDHPIWGGW